MHDIAAISKTLSDAHRNPLKTDSAPESNIRITNFSRQAEMQENLYYLSKNRQNIDFSSC